MREKIIFFGDWDGNEYTPNIKIYDVNTDTQVKETPPIKARGWTSTISVGDKAIFFGGWKGSGIPSSAIDVYDNDKDVWKTVNQREYNPQARIYASTAVIGNKAIFFGGVMCKEPFIFGGEDCYLSSDVDIYDAESDTWTGFKIEGPELKAGHIAFVKGSKAVFVGVALDGTAKMYELELLPPM